VWKHSIENSHQKISFEYLSIVSKPRFVVVRFSLSVDSSYATILKKARERKYLS